MDPSLSDISREAWLLFGAFHLAAVVVFLTVRPISRWATRELRGYSATSWTVPPLWVGIGNGIIERLLIAGVVAFSLEDAVLVGIAWLTLKTALSLRGFWGEDTARRVNGIIFLWTSVASMLAGAASGYLLRAQAA
ncbi:MAG: hypothetical protein OXL97_15290 [Chloroflexota bacterium]|nr:hypothetical protein [Chloroflexota bacterium]MDE2883600.1 hypothetical protein [Chloroflexota bacterium]